MSQTSHLSVITILNNAKKLNSFLFQGLNQVFTLFNFNHDTLELKNQYQFKFSTNIRQINSFSLVNENSSYEIVCFIQTNNLIYYLQFSIDKTADIKLKELSNQITCETPKNILYLSSIKRFCFLSSIEIEITKEIKNSFSDISIEPRKIPFVKEGGAIQSLISNSIESFHQGKVLNQSRAFILQTTNISTDFPNLHWCKWDFEVLKIEVVWRKPFLSKTIVFELFESPIDQHSFGLVYSNNTLFLVDETGILSQLKLSAESPIFSMSLSSQISNQISSGSTISVVLSSIGFKFLDLSIDVETNNLSIIKEYELQFLPSNSKVSLIPNKDQIFILDILQSSRLVIGTSSQYGSQVYVSEDIYSLDQNISSLFTFSEQFSFLKIDAIQLVKYSASMNIQSYICSTIDERNNTLLLTNAEFGLSLQVKNRQLLDLDQALIDFEVRHIEHCYSQNRFQSFFLYLTSLKCHSTILLKYQDIDQSFDIISSGYISNESTLYFYNISLDIFLQITETSVSFLSIPISSFESNVLWSSSIIQLILKFISPTQQLLFEEIQSDFKSKGLVFSTILFVNFTTNSLKIWIPKYCIIINWKSGSFNKGFWNSISCIATIEIVSQTEEIACISTLSTYNSTTGNITLNATSFWNNSNIELEYISNNSSISNSFQIETCTNFSIVKKMSLLLISEATKQYLLILNVLDHLNQSYLQIYLINFQTTKLSFETKLLWKYEIFSYVEYILTFKQSEEIVDLILFYNIPEVSINKAQLFNLNIKINCLLECQPTNPFTLSPIHLSYSNNRLLSPHVVGSNLVLLVNDSSKFSFLFTNFKPVLSSISGTRIDKLQKQCFSPIFYQSLSLFRAVKWVIDSINNVIYVLLSSSSSRLISSSMTLQIYSLSNLKLLWENECNSSLFPFIDPDFLDTSTILDIIPGPSYFNFRNHNNCENTGTATIIFLESWHREETRPNVSWAYVVVQWDIKQSYFRMLGTYSTSSSSISTQMLSMNPIRIFNFTDEIIASITLDGKITLLTWSQQLQNNSKSFSFQPISEILLPIDLMKHVILEFKVLDNFLFLSLKDFGLKVYSILNQNMLQECFEIKDESKPIEFIDLFITKINDEIEDGNITLIILCYDRVNIKHHVYSCLVINKWSLLPPQAIPNEEGTKVIIQHSEHNWPKETMDFDYNDILTRIRKLSQSQNQDKDNLERTTEHKLSSLLGSNANFFIHTPLIQMISFE